MKTGTKLKKAIVFMLVAVMLISALAFTGCSLFGKDNENPDNTGGNENPPIIQPDDTEIPEDKEAIYLTQAMAFSEPTAQDDAGILVKATVKPDNAYDKTVDWAVAFKNASSTWATGKNVTDYVTVTPLLDGSTTATIKCLKQFKEQIIITVTSRANASLKASCAVDYMFKFDTAELGVKSYIGGIMGEISPATLTFSNTLPSVASATFDYTTNAKWYVNPFALENVLNDNLSSIYSITPTVNSVKLSYKISDELNTALNAKGITASTEYKTVTTGTFLDGTYTSATNVAFNDAFSTATFGIKKGDAKWETLRSAIEQATNSSLVFKLDIVCAHGTLTYYSAVKLNQASMIVAESITLDSTQVYF